MHPDNVAKMPWTSDFRIDHRAGQRRIQLLDQSGGEDVGSSVTVSLQSVVNTAIEFNLFPTIGKHSEHKRLAGANYCKNEFLDSRPPGKLLWGPLNSISHAP